MRINNINNIRFGENSLSSNMNSRDAGLMLRDSNALVKFKRNQDLAHKADSIDANPFLAIGYKLYRTFSKISAENNKNYQLKENLIA
ncbi:hypothetical protein IJO12_09390 [bacterium]|nr:hypothetical protein [bacterium]